MSILASSKLKLTISFHGASQQRLKATEFAPTATQRRVALGPSWTSTDTMWSTSSISTKAYWILLSLGSGSMKWPFNSDVHWDSTPLSRRIWVQILLLFSLAQSAEASSHTRQQGYTNWSKRFGKISAGHYFAEPMLTYNRKGLSIHLPLVMKMSIPAAHPFITFSSCPAETAPGYGGNAE